MAEVMAQAMTDVVSALSEAFDHMKEGAVGVLGPMLERAGLPEHLRTPQAVGVALVTLALLLLLLLWCCCCRSKRRAREFRLLEDNEPRPSTRAAPTDCSTDCSLRCSWSVKLAWLSIPLPYISCSCSPPAAAEARTGGAKAWPKRYGDGASQTDAAHAPSPSKAGGPCECEPVVTEVVALQVRGRWQGPLNVWLTGVDALPHQQVGLRQRRPAAQHQPWTKLAAEGTAAASLSTTGEGEGGGEEGEVSVIEFAEPVRLRSGFGCRLAVHVEAPKPQPHTQAGALVGAGETTLSVYDSVYAAVHSSVRDDLRSVGEQPRLMAPADTSPRSSPRSSPRAHASPPHYAQYGAASGRRGGAQQFLDDDALDEYDEPHSFWDDYGQQQRRQQQQPVSYSSPNSYRTAALRQIHGGLSPV
jgi:hypothetical protein